MHNAEQAVTAEAAFKLVNETTVDNVEEVPQAAKHLLCPSMIRFTFQRAIAGDDWIEGD